MMYAKLAVFVTLISAPIGAMQRCLPKLIKASQGTQRAIPSDQSLSPVDLAKALVSEDRLSIKKAGDVDVFTLAVQIESGAFKHIWNCDDIRKVLRRDLFVFLADLFKKQRKVIRLTSWPAKKGSSKIRALALSSDGEKLAISLHCITIWDIEALPKPGMPPILGNPVILERSCLRVREAELRWSHDGTQLFACKKGNLICWDVSTGKMLYSYEVLNGKRKKLRALSPCGKYMLGAEIHARITSTELCPRVYAMSMKGILFDLRSVYKHFAGKQEESEEEGEIPCASITCHKENFCIWQKNDPRHRLFTTFSPDGTYAVTAGCDNTVQVCDLSELPEIKVREFKHKSIVSAVAFSPDSKQLVTASSYLDTMYRDKRGVYRHKVVAYVWNLADGTSKPVVSFLKKDLLKSLTFDGRFICFGGHFLYDIHKRCGVALPYAATSKTGALFTPDMSYMLATGGYKNTDVYAISLVGLSEKYTLPQLVLLAKLDQGSLRPEFKERAFKILSTFEKSERGKLKPIIQKYFNG